MDFVRARWRPTGCGGGEVGRGHGRGWVGKGKDSKTGTIAPGSTVQPKRSADLDAMAFFQGGYLMSNKKCKLPDGSFKRLKKGYEEIHIPASKKQPLARLFKRLSSLNGWAKLSTVFRRWIVFRASSIQSLLIRTIRVFFVLLLAQERSILTFALKHCTYFTSAV